MSYKFKAQLSDPHCPFKLVSIDG